MTGIIDAHQHVWDLERAEYGWLTPEAGVLHRTIEMAEVLPEFAAAGVVGTVLVQSADNDDDTDHMFEVAAREPLVRGIVGYVPLHEPARAAERLADLRGRPLFCGVRNLIHDRPDPRWLRRPDVDESLGLLAAAGVPFDVVGVLPEHLEAVLEISERHPELDIVIDHLNKPPIGADDAFGTGVWQPWATLIAAVAENPRVRGKVSGLYAATGDPAAWTVDTVRPVFEHVLAVFGSDRLMYGGDWPVSLIAGGYAQVWHGIAELVDDLTDAERTEILAGTARRFYSLPESETTA
ncbi:L-fuconolactonase [Agromyces sp. CF514]|uniref:amidohydrolase family protein n=1 Tax=Agromyces sp. CF514 TaxID=1881031 RepID=UPI0008EB6B00|nr:amidohydrolase family protein [Agromyces sp. CF514]SFR70786.1 L-fuconolactonase [Agromyces sp. CF514]